MRYPIYEMLTEGRDAPLYHATPATNFTDIMSRNELEARTKQMIPLPGTEKGFRWIDGLSLTRNFRFAKKWVEGNGVIFELDQRKLAQTHKIIPFDFFRNDANRRTKEKAESEEFVVGSIRNLTKYIKTVYLLDNDEDPIYKAIRKEIARDYPSIEVKTIK